MKNDPDPCEACARCCFVRGDQRGAARVRAGRPSARISSATSCDWISMDTRSGDSGNGEALGLPFVSAARLRRDGA